MLAASVSSRIALGCAFVSAAVGFRFGRRGFVAPVVSVGWIRAALRFRPRRFRGGRRRGDLRRFARRREQRVVRARFAFRRFRRRHFGGRRRRPRRARRHRGARRRGARRGRRRLRDRQRRRWWRVLFELSAAAPAAAAAALSSTATSASVLSGRQPRRSPRLPGWPAPHCRHHSWPSRSGAPQLLQVRSADPASHRSGPSDRRPGGQPQVAARSREQPEDRPARYSLQINSTPGRPVPRRDGAQAIRPGRSHGPSGAVARRAPAASSSA